MKRNNRFSVSLLSWTLAALLLSGQASAALEGGDSSAIAGNSETAEAVKSVGDLEDAESVENVKSVESAESDVPVQTAEDLSGADAENAESGVVTADGPETGATVEAPDIDAENPEEETAELQGIFGWKSSRHLSVTVEDWRLGETPNPPAVTGSVEDAPLVFVYRDTGGSIVPDIASAPAGTYTVTVFAEETEEYAAASARGSFTILPSYTVTWVNEDGSLLEADKFVEPGTVPHYDGEEPAKAATPAYTYSFQGWDPALTGDSVVTGNMTYTAVYAETLNQYSVYFLNDDGTTLRHAVYGYGTKAEDIVRPADPQKGLTSQYAFTFRGWTPEIADVTGDVVYTAVYDRTPVEIYHYKETPKSAFTTLAEPCEGGMVRILPAEARPGTPVLLTPVPDSGYILDVLIVRGLGRTETLALSGNGNKFSFTMPSFDVSVTASFRKLDTAADDGVQDTAKTDTGVQDTAKTDTGVQDTGVQDGDSSEVSQYSLAKTGFRDVPASAYYSRAVQWATEGNVLPGISKTAFAPDSPCTRAQMVLALWRASGSPRPSIGYGNPFSDVDVNSPCYEAVLWAMEKGVTRGITSSTFAPDRPVSRAQAVTLLYRLRGFQAKRANPFSDAAQGQYFYEAALWACSVGITRGTTASTFTPHDFCSRAQAAAFLFRAFEG